MDPEDLNRKDEHTEEEAPLIPEPDPEDNALIPDPEDNALVSDPEDSGFDRRP